MRGLRFHPRVGIAVAGLTFLSLALVSVVLAQRPTPATEPDAVQPAGRSEAAYDSATSTGLPPDENPVVGGVQVPTAPNQVFSYYVVAGATLRGRSSTTGYAYDSSGCSHVTSGTGTGTILNTELQLPEGAVIKYLRVYYRDTNPSNGVTGYITRYQPGQGTADLVNASSGGSFAGGFGFVVSSEITETVTNAPYAYTLIGWPDVANSANQICGLRVAYYSPLTASFLPMIFKGS